MSNLYFSFVSDHVYQEGVTHPSDDLSSVLGSGEAAMVWIWDTWFDEDFVAGRYGPSDFALMPVFSGTTDKGSYEGGTDL